MTRKEKVRRRMRRPKRGFSAWAPWKKALAIAGGVVVLIMTAGVVFAATKLSKIETTKLDASKLNISTEVEYNQTGYLNVALFGLDTRENEVEEGERSDTIIVASLNRETKEVRLCSIYRDTVLQQDDETYNKANSAYSFGGAEEAVAMLNKNLDMDIQHYVTVNFSALIDVIDALGGIEIDLTEEEVNATNGYATETAKVTGNEKVVLTQPGLQTLDGVQGVSYCRIRNTTGDDFRRTERQRAVLEQIVKKAQTADLSTINRIIDKVFPQISTNFTLTETLAYAKDAFDYRLTQMDGFPFEKSTATLSGIGSAVLPESLLSNVVQLHTFFFGEDGYSPSSIVNGISSEVTQYGTNTVPDTTEYGTTDYGSESWGYDTGGTGGNTGYTAPSEIDQSQETGGDNGSGYTGTQGVTGDTTSTQEYQTQ